METLGPTIGLHDDVDFAFLVLAVLGLGIPGAPDHGPSHALGELPAFVQGVQEAHAAVILETFGCGVIQIQASLRDQTKLEALAPTVAHDGHADDFPGVTLAEQLAQGRATGDTVITYRRNPIPRAQAGVGSGAPGDEPGDDRSIVPLPQVDPDDAPLRLVIGHDLEREIDVSGDLDDPQDLRALRRLGYLLGGGDHGREQESGEGAELCRSEGLPEHLAEFHAGGLLREARGGTAVSGFV